MSCRVKRLIPARTRPRTANPANDPAGTAPNGLNNLSHAAQTLAGGGNGDPANRGHDRPDDDGQEGEEDRAKRRRI